MWSLRWGGETLEQIGLDESVPKEHRERACALHAIYPSAEQFKALMADEAVGLPAMLADRLAQTVSLLTDVQRSGLGSAKTQRAILFALRHYPDKSLIAFLTGDVSLAYWFRHEKFD